MLDYTKKAIDFAAAIGCKNLVFGCPRNRSLPAGADESVAVAFFKELGEYAYSKGTAIGMEANPPIYNTNYINDTKSALELIEQVDSKGFKLNLDVGTRIFIFEMVLLIIICVMHSLSAGHYANYYLINGTFQNFNPVRRLLSGQIPYRDFQDYLGMGHLYFGTILTALYGGDYQGSLQAFSFLTFGGLALLSLMVSMTVIKRKEIAGALTNILLIVFLVESLFFKNGFAGTSEILEALEYALGTGNSARFIRGMILPIACFLILLGFLIYKKFFSVKFIKYKEIFIYVGIGIVAGFSFAWSNDYGVSCWLCLLIMAFWLVICRKRSITNSIVSLAIAAGSSIVCLFIMIEIFTMGHFGQWFSATFGTGGFQSWYYNSSKSYYLNDVDFSYIMLIQAGLAIVYLIKLFMVKGTMSACRRYGFLAFANMVCLCAVNEYKVLSGGSSREVALSVLFLNIAVESGLLFADLQNKKKVVQVLLVPSSIIGIAWVIATAKDEFVFKYMTDKEGVQIEALGGKLTSLGDDLLETEKFLNGEEFFATYASAQEVVNNTYQPSGTDYIIHVLGDRQRENYLDAFENGDFKYAATMREEYTDWESWAKTANWFFYRKLYQSWHPVYANTYELYWSRNEEDDENLISSGFTLSVVDVDDSTKKIIVQCENPVNGTADVYIDYSVDKKGNRSSIINIQRMLRVENTGTVYAGGGSYYESDYLRSKSAEYIPVFVVNGYGEVTLTSNPVRSTNLTLNQAECDCIYTVMSDYIVLQGIQTEEHYFGL